MLSQPICQGILNAEGGPKDEVMHTICLRPDNNEPQMDLDLKIKSVQSQCPLEVKPIHQPERPANSTSGSPPSFGFVVFSFL